MGNDWPTPKLPETGITFGGITLCPYRPPRPVLSRGLWYQSPGGTVWHRMSGLAWCVGRLLRCEGRYLRVEAR